MNLASNFENPMTDPPSDSETLVIFWIEILLIVKIPENNISKIFNQCQIFFKNLRSKVNLKIIAKILKSFVKIFTKEQKNEECPLMFKRTWALLVEFFFWIFGREIPSALAAFAWNISLNIAKEVNCLMLKKCLFMLQIIKSSNLHMTKII